MTIWILADIAILLIIGIFGYTSMKRGFLKSSFGPIASFVSLLLVFSLHTPFQGYLENSFVGDTVREKISISVETSLYANPDIDASEPDSSTAAEIIENLKLPGFMTGMLSDAIKNPSSGYENIRDGLIDGVTDLIFPVVMQILSVVLLYLLLRAGLWIIFFILKMIVEFPIFGAADKLLGAVTGAVNALLIIYLAAALIMLLLPVNSPSEAGINSTFIFKYFYYNNLITNLFF